MRLAPAGVYAERSLERFVFNGLLRVDRSQIGRVGSLRGTVVSVLLALCAFLLTDPKAAIPLCTGLVFGSVA